MTLLGWREWHDTSPDLCLVLAILLIGGCAACHTMSVPETIPPCPAPTMEMIEEASSGALWDAPAVVDYLGRIENYCDGIAALDGD